ncbi:5-(carboxyamino)imidazole ribonucleotide synthase [Stackebrandtia endophytica]|uniref:N5-carboxyaminoimidazole ribonucleotide synthase n=1 Tax=Stackebrandtia endophytica TaxID=1496996 RepID=A0A543AT95_9ACTN|nr:5-(carboxyamino)imidazole ribonucleotide synthase [Stackebrandtia endophytica]TQL75817.1 5-(carboxyamino)imidazole ribonucleotide synthase [Stackebrandtia endophytica]
MDDRTQLPIVGMIGGGQLARMTHQAAIALGQSLRVLAASPDDSAAVVANDVRIGDHDDPTALAEFAAGCEVVTFDHEHVPQERIHELLRAGHVVRPGPEALRFAQDKLAMRRRLAELDLPMPRWAPVDGADDLTKFGLPCVVKTATGGYDGKGVFMVDDPARIAPMLADGVRLLAEERVPLVRELAVQIARSPSGETRVYPVVETVQRDGICTEVIAPAPDLSAERNAEAARIAERVAVELDVTGILAVELFDTGDRLLINELAMRPHNSGHWTIEGTVTSQFEQHLRAVLDYPLGEVAMTAPVVVMANVLGGEPGGPRLDERVQRLLADDPAARVHLYGKAVRPGRKIGHVTIAGDDVDGLRKRARHAAAVLRDGS